MEMIKNIFFIMGFCLNHQACFGVLMVIGYFFDEGKYIFVRSCVFMVQAVFNIGCPGGSCSTDVPKKRAKKPVINLFEIQTNKAKRDVYITFYVSRSQCT